MRQEGKFFPLITFLMSLIFLYCLLISIKFSRYGLKDIATNGNNGWHVKPDFVIFI